MSSSLKTNPQLQIFDSFHSHQSHVFVDSLKQKIEQKWKIKLSSDCYFSHPNFRLLCIYLFFALAPANIRKSSEPKSLLKKAYQNMGHSIQLSMTKFWLKWNQIFDLGQTMWNNHNTLIMNKILLQEISKTLSIEECEKLLKKSLNDLDIRLGVIDGRERNLIMNRNAKNWILFVKEQENWVLSVLSTRETPTHPENTSQQSFSFRQIKTFQQKTQRDEYNIGILEAILVGFIFAVLISQFMKSISLSIANHQSFSLKCNICKCIADLAKSIGIKCPPKQFTNFL